MPLKVTGLTIKKYMGIKELTLGSPEFPLSEKFNHFIGKNSACKTDIIKAIPAGLLGTTDPSVIHTGADQAEIIIDLEKYRIHRVITQKGQRVKTTSEDKSVNTTLQTYIDELIGISDKDKRKFLFNPIGFVLSEDKAKYLREFFKTSCTAEMLKEAGVSDDDVKALDFTQDGLAVVKSILTVLETRRTETNRTVKTKKGAYEDAIGKLPKEFKPEDYDPAAIETNQKSVEDLTNRKAAAKALAEQQEKNQKTMDELKRKIEEDTALISRLNDDSALEVKRERCNQRLKAIDSEIEELQNRINALREEQTSVENEHSSIVGEITLKRDANQRITENQATLDGFKIEAIEDIDALQAQITEKQAEGKRLETLKTHHTEYQRIQTILKPEKEEVEAKSEALTATIKKLRDETIAKIIKDANIPIEGLQLDGDRGFINGVNLDHMSTSEQMILGCQMVERMNEGSNLKLLGVDRLECLDDDSLEVLLQWVTEKDWQMFATSVYHEGQNVPDGSYWVDEGQVSKERPARKKKGGDLFNGEGTK